MVERQTIHLIAVEHLTLDPVNPRLPEELLHAIQPVILTWLFGESVLDELARSLLTNGFFQHEPLVVLPEDEDGNYLVIEGNRRLAALMILLQTPIAMDADIGFEFETTPNRGQLERLSEVPCFVVADKTEVHKFLGFRHIGGLKTWSPESKARYLETEIERAIDNGSLSAIRDVARQVGSTVPAVRGQYLALKVLRAARNNHKINTSAITRQRFGVWNRLMNSPHVRDFIGLAEVTTAEEILTAVENLNGQNLHQVVSDLTPPAGAGKAVLWDSRDATIYGNVVANTKARESLVKYGDLSIARQIVERGELPDRLRGIVRSVEIITQDIDTYEIDQNVAMIAAGLASVARTLRDTIQGRLDGDD